MISTVSSAAFGTFTFDDFSVKIVAVIVAVVVTLYLIKS